EGWMGPLAVRDDCQGAGQGKAIVRAGITHLAAAGCRTIGLETMPRTVDNIGFYSALGFVPGAITVTLTLEAGPPTAMRGLLSQVGAADRDAAVDECRALTAACAPGVDFSREMRLTHELGLGDTLMLRRDGILVAFAVCHAAPLVEGRSREELRVLKLVAADLAAMGALLDPLTALARRSATARVAIRVQGNFPDAYARIARAGGRVRWTDLRMSLADHPSRAPARGIVFSNWEI
ncbi:MAG TPA: GNAT family N-acetyltransferase, partial [Gemmatimonadaceae bacterium]|nr:GNAT family N-acetyltransferase [Gemmatimonadaceae bacterium]